MRETDGKATDCYPFPLHLSTAGAPKNRPRPLVKFQPVQVVNFRPAPTALIKLHAQDGYEILKSIDFPWPIAQFVGQHHERLDGSGYPHGLQGDVIHLEARILAVADVIEAMASHRPYRPGLGIDVALAEVSEKCGVTYDENVVAAAIRLFREKDYQLQA